MITDIVIIEDKYDTIQRLEHIVKAVDGLHLKASFRDAESLIENYKNINPALILMDIDLGANHISGIEAVRKIKKIDTGVKIIMCTTLDDDANILFAIVSGACGYLIKSDSNERIAMHIQDAIAGGAAMSPQIAMRLIQLLKQDNIDPEVLEKITQRQWEVLELLNRGNSQKMVAHQLGISYNTVKEHCGNIYINLAVNSLQEALNKLFGKNKK